MKFKFRLNEFKAIAKWLDKYLPGPLAYFLNGWLYGLESRYIDAKVSSALDKAIAPLKPSEPSLSEPTFTSTPSEVEGLDIIQLSHIYDD
jgi:hypothetical protein